MITIGSDVHLKTTTFSVRNSEGQIITRKRIDNEPMRLLNFIRQFNGPKQYAMEASYHWPLFYNLLKDEVDKFYLLHPLKLKAIIESQSKNDKKDADTLSYLTHIGHMPQSHKAEPQTHIMRRFLRTRVSMSREVTAIKNRIQAIVNSYIFYLQRPKNFKDLFCQRGLQWLQTVELPSEARTLINHLLTEMFQTQDVQKSLDKDIENMEYKTSDIQVISTVPGFRKSKLLKYIVVAEIDDINRFKNARSLVAYAGLVPKEHSSGDKIRRGKLRTHANEFIKWAMLEAVYGAILADKNLKQYYKQVKERTNSSSAKVATARKLLTIMYHVLKEQKPYKSVSSTNDSHATIR